MAECLACCRFSDVGPETSLVGSVGPDTSSKKCDILFNCHCEGIFPDSENNLECWR